MFRNMIAPVQAWFLSQGKCVGCGKQLLKTKHHGVEKIICECSRIYIYDADSNKFRRATYEEAK